MGGHINDIFKKQQSGQLHDDAARVGGVVLSRSTWFTTHDSKIISGANNHAAAVSFRVSGNSFIYITKPDTQAARLACHY